MNLKEYKRKALKDPSFRKEYERFDPRMEIEILWMKAKMYFRNLFR